MNHVILTLLKYENTFSGNCPCVGMCYKHIITLALFIIKNVAVVIIIKYFSYIYTNCLFISHSSYLNLSNLVSKFHFYKFPRFKDKIRLSHLFSFRTSLEHNITRETLEILSQTKLCTYHFLMAGRVLLYHSFTIL